MQSKAKTVAQHLAALPSDRRVLLEQVRAVILANLDRDYEEGMQYGMIGYYVPHRVFPDGYHCDPRQPLPFAALAAQKNYSSLHLLGPYADGDDAKWFVEAWTRTGRKLDMGKCCVRFKTIDDVALDVVAESIRRSPVQRYLATYRAARPVKARPRPAADRTAARAKPAARQVSQPAKPRRPR